MKPTRYGVCVSHAALDVGCKVLLRVLMNFQFIRALVELVGEKVIYDKKCLKKKGKTQK